MEGSPTFFLFDPNRTDRISNSEMDDYSIFLNQKLFGSFDPLGMESCRQLTLQDLVDTISENSGSGSDSPNALSLNNSTNATIVNTPNMNNQNHNRKHRRRTNEDLGPEELSIKRQKVLNYINLSKMKQHGGVGKKKQRRCLFAKKS
jgi:hypothetical protein